jgi:predicted HAD superfamily Cof-like phosphohydrolase
MVKDFHYAFGNPVSDIQKTLDAERRKKRASWMYEEIDEFVQAVSLVDQLDALADLVYFALGTAVEMGTDLEPIFEIVHRANMNKLGPDGKPIYRESDGKVLKPKEWTPPEETIGELLNAKTKEKKE